MNSKAVQKLKYPIALILSTNGKKTCESLAQVINKSGDTMLRLLEHDCATFDELISLAKVLFGNNVVYLVIDDVLLAKIYSMLIQGTSDNFDPSNNTTYRSLCSVAALLTDGKYALPIDHKIWSSKEVAQDNYKTKVELAQELIMKIASTITIKLVIMDGLYATINMITWLNQQGLFFETRFHSNRVISMGSEKPLAIKSHRNLHLKGKKKIKTVSAYWKGIHLYVTAVKRKTKNDEYIAIYQASNYRALARDHVRIYSYRWHIEMFFRTAKQSLGLTHCQSRKLELQNNHIRNVFFAYTILQFERRKRKLKNPESALRALKHKSYSSCIAYLQSAVQNFGVVYA
jgi:hypothetical protein